MKKNFDIENDVKPAHLPLNGETVRFVDTDQAPIVSW